MNIHVGLKQWKLYTYIFGIIIIASCNIVSIWWTPSTFRATRGHRRSLHDHLWLHHNLRRRVLWRLLCDCGERQIRRNSSWILHFTTWPCRPHRQISYLLLKLRWVFWRWGWDSFSVILWTYLKEHLKISYHNSKYNESGKTLFAFCLHGLVPQGYLLTHKAPPITCIKRQFQILPIFKK